MLEKQGGLTIKTWQEMLTNSKFSLVEMVDKEIDDLVLKAESERADALGEIISQNADFIGEFLGLLGTDAVRRKATFALLDAVSLVALMAVMHFKLINNRRRPSQVCPALNPPVTVPGHASYPSGHSTQAMLMAATLGQVFEGKTQNGVLVSTRASWWRWMTRSGAQR